MPLSKNQIIAANDLKLAEIDMTEEWGGVVHVRTLTGTERDAFEESYSQNKMRAFRSRFLVLCLCDEKGNRLFSDQDVDALGGKSSASLNKAFEAAWSHNAFTPAAVDAMGKDSPSDQSGDSTSA